MKISEKQKKILIFILSFSFLFSLNFFRLKVKNFFYLISAPIQKQLWKGGQGVAGFLRGVFEVEKLKEENKNLKTKNQELLAELFALKEVKKENEFLKKALEIGLEKEFILDLVEVIGRDIGNDLLLINKGKKEGIKKELPVITGEKVLIGKVEEVYENFSKVKLISAKNSFFDGEIPEKEIYGLVKGRGNCQISFELLPLEKEIREKDVVITSSLGGIFPKGLLVGEIKKIEKSDLEAFQKAEIQPYFEIDKLKFLFVIKQW